LNQSLPDEHGSPGQSIAKWLDAIYLNVANDSVLDQANVLAHKDLLFEEGKAGERREAWASTS
jgi:hypothetical protein